MPSVPSGNGMNVSKEMYQTLFKSDYAKFLVQKALDSNPNDDDAVIEQLHTELEKAANADGKITDDEKSLMDALNWKGLFGTNKEIVKANLAEVLKVHKAEANKVNFNAINIKTQDGVSGMFGGTQNRVLSLRNEIFDDHRLEKAITTVKPAQPPVKPPAQQAATPVKTGTTPAKSGTTPASSGSTPAKTGNHPVSGTHPQGSTPVKPPVASKEPVKPVQAPAADPKVEPKVEPKPVPAQDPQPVAPESMPDGKFAQLQSQLSAAEKALEGVKQGVKDPEQLKAVQKGANDSFSMPESQQDINETLERANKWASDDLVQTGKNLSQLLDTIEANPAGYGNPDTKPLRALLSQLGTLKTTKDADGKTTQEFVLKNSPPGVKDLNLLDQLKGQVQDLRTKATSGDGPVVATADALVQKGASAENPAIQLAKQNPELIKYADMLSKLKSYGANQQMLDALMSGDEASVKTFFENYQSSWAERLGLSTTLIGLSSSVGLAAPLLAWTPAVASTLSTMSFNPAANALLPKLTEPNLNFDEMYSADAPTTLADISTMDLTLGKHSSTLGTTSIMNPSASLLNTHLSAATIPLTKPGSDMALSGINQSDVIGLMQYLKDHPEAKELLTAQGGSLDQVLSSPEGQKLKSAATVTQRFDEIVNNFQNASTWTESAVGKQTNILSSLEVSAKAVDDALKDTQIRPEAKQYLLDQKAALQGAIAQVKAGKPVTPVTVTHVADSSTGKTAKVEVSLDPNLLAKAKDFRNAAARDAAVTPMSDDVANLARAQAFDPLFQRISDSLKAGGDMETLISKLPEPQQGEMKKMFLKSIPLEEGTMLSGQMYLDGIKAQIQNGKMQNMDFAMQSYLKNVVALLDKASQPDVDAAKLQHFASYEVQRGDVSGNNLQLIDDMSRFNDYTQRILQMTGSPEAAQGAMEAFFNASSTSIQDGLTKKVDRTKMYAAWDNSFNRIQQKMFIDGNPDANGTVAAAKLQQNQLQITQSSGQISEILKDPNMARLMTDLLADVPGKLQNTPLKDLKGPELMEFATASPDKLKAMLGGKPPDMPSLLQLQMQALDAINGSAKTLSGKQTGAVAAAQKELENLQTGLGRLKKDVSDLRENYQKQFKLDGEHTFSSFQTGKAKMREATGLTQAEYDAAFGFNAINKNGRGGPNAQVGHYLMTVSSMSKEEFAAKIGKKPGDAGVDAMYINFRSAARQSLVSYFASPVFDRANGVDPGMKKNAQWLNQMYLAKNAGELPQMTEAQWDGLLAKFSSNDGSFMAEVQKLTKGTSMETQVATDIALSTTDTNAPAGVGGAPSSSGGAPSNGGLATAADVAFVSAGAKAVASLKFAAEVQGKSLDAPLATILARINSGKSDEIKEDDIQYDGDPAKGAFLIKGHDGKPDERFEVGPPPAEMTGQPANKSSGEPVSDGDQSVDGATGAPATPALQPPAFFSTMTSDIKADDTLLAAAPPTTKAAVAKFSAEMFQTNAKQIADYQQQMSTILDQRKQINTNIAKDREQITSAMKNLQQLMKDNPGLRGELEDKLKPPAELPETDKTKEADALEASSNLAPAPAISGEELFEKWLTETLGIIRNWDEATRKLIMAQIAKQMMDQVINTFYKDKSDEAANYHNKKIGEIDAGSKARMQATDASANLAKASGGQSIAALSGSSKGSERGEAFNLEALRKQGVSGIREQLAQEIHNARTAQPPIGISAAQERNIMARFDAIIKAAGTDPINDDQLAVGALRGNLAGFMPGQPYRN